MPTVARQALNEEKRSAVQALINGEAPERPQLAWRSRQSAMLAQGRGDYDVL
jgi:hypothetical protein